MPRVEASSRRFKDNQGKLRVGDLHVIAAVVRDLTRREHSKGLSSGEKRMLESARNPVLAELCLGLSLSDEQAEEQLVSAIRSARAGPEERGLVAAG